MGMSGIRLWGVGFGLCLLGFGSAMEDAPGEPLVLTMRCSAVRGHGGSAPPRRGGLAAGRALLLDVCSGCPGRQPGFDPTSECPQAWWGPVIGRWPPQTPCVTWAPRGSRRPSDPLLDLVWRKLADGPTSGIQSRSGVAGPPPLLDIAQVRYSPTSERESRRGMAGLLWLLSRASIHRLGVRGRAWDGTGVEEMAPPTSRGGDAFACAAGLRDGLWDGLGR